MGNLKETDRLEYIGVDEKIILKRDLQGTGWEGMDSIRLAQDKDK